jgi:hypothetical protein
MSRFESNATVENYKNTKTKKSALKTKVSAALTLLGLSGLVTLSYLNDNIFIEHIAVSAFIISCIAIIKLMETK